MELVYGYTRDYAAGLRHLPATDLKAITKAVNDLGEATLEDQESPPAKIVQPARLILKHRYTATLGILPVSDSAHVLLCYDYDRLNNQILVSLLTITHSKESNQRFFVLAKALYGPLLLGVE